MSGTKLTIGTSPSRPTSLHAPALLEHRGDDAERGADRDEVHDARGQRDDDRAEREQQQHEAQRDDDRDRQHEAARDLVGEVDVARGRAADVGGHVLALRRRRDRVVAQACARACSVARSDGAVVGVAVITAAVPESLTSGWVTESTPDVFSRSSRRSCRRGSVAGWSACLRWSSACCSICLRLLVELRLDLRLRLLLRLGGRHALGLEARRDLLLLRVGLLLGLLLLVGLLLVDLVELALVGLRRLASTGRR